MIAHKRESDGKEQAWKEHSRNVSKLCFLSAEKLNLSTLAKLIGLLHDFGKGISDFQGYLQGTGSKHPNHAALGALYVQQRWWDPGKTLKERQTAQLISLCIYGHHAGLPDCLDISGTSPYLNGLQSQPDNYYTEAMANFYSEVASAEELDKLFAEACKELEKFGLDKYSFQWGMLARLMLSILVDADRWDSACFEYDADPFDTSQDTHPDWKKLLIKLETYVEGFPKEGELARIRRDISEWCRAAGEYGPGIYTLSVPTGGGKTYSSLRFALAQAKKNGQQRIFYFIPMNTILDQNSRDIRDALADYPSILEHHSNVVLENEVEEENYRRLTERWDCNIILTSLVQFLDTLFKNGNGRVRRMYRLANSVLIFDEIQALPKKCRELFKKAIQFLVQYCNCTVLLCTATQPNLGLESNELIPDVKSLYQKLKRVAYMPQLEMHTYQEASGDIAAFIQEGKSVLTIVNTKDAAWNVFQGISEQLKILDYSLVEIQQGLSEEVIEQCAAKSTENEILCVHLSTLMCPMHRKEILCWVKSWLKKKKLVCCISTALIEAGINVSFPVVIRSLAGIPSMIQAAGRCNRNCEEKMGTVYLWNLADERLGRLPDIQKGKELSMNLLSNMEHPDEMGSPEMIKKYFAKEEEYTQKVEKYPYKEWNLDLVTMLSANSECRNAAYDSEDSPLLHLSKRFCQSFRTAGAAFQVIDQKTKSVIVPYGRGKELIEKLTDRHTLWEEIKYLKEAQQYSVNLFEHVFERLAKEGALHSLGETGVVVLKEEYYDAWAGVTTTPQEMMELII
ncbi:CRISPR-associated endonuclease Cas3'' [Lactonifactor longoviformis]|uniref:CRISPR-associated endonuclease Cas3'' n=1 Tax=Lactonifactor longoviformis TaxID=341220 RepID=UPI0036F1EF86